MTLRAARPLRQRHWIICCAPLLPRKKLECSNEPMRLEYYSRVCHGNKSPAAAHRLVGEVEGVYLGRRQLLLGGAGGLGRGRPAVAVRRGGLLLRGRRLRQDLLCRLQRLLQVPPQLVQLRTQRSGQSSVGIFTLCMNLRVDLTLQTSRHDIAPSLLPMYPEVPHLVAWSRVCQRSRFRCMTRVQLHNAVYKVDSCSTRTERTAISARRTCRWLLLA